MKIKFGHKETYLNSVLVNGQIIGVFYSHETWTKLGSKRAIVEYLFRRYDAETNIEIIAQNVSTIPVLTYD